MAESYELEYHAAALDFLQSLPRKIRRQIRNKVDRLKDDPHAIPHDKVRSQSDDQDTVLRIRSGDYRILYVAHADRKISVIDIGLRRDIYGRS